MFDTQKVSDLSTFYRYRIHEDLKKKIILPNKGTIAKVIDGELDRKANDTFLIKLWYDTNLLPGIAAIPEAPIIEVPAISILTPTFIDFYNDNHTFIINRVDEEWLLHARQCIVSIGTPSNDHAEFVLSHVSLCCKKIMSRLYGFLRTRIPLHRNSFTTTHFRSFKYFLRILMY